MCVLDGGSRGVCVTKASIRIMLKLRGSTFLHSCIVAMTVSPSFMCGPCSSPSHTDSQLPNRRNNTPSLLHMDKWTKYGWLWRGRWVNEVSGSVRGAPSRACAALIPCAETSANVGVRGNAATNKPIALVQRDSGIEKIVTRWPTRGRFLWTMPPYPPVTKPRGFESTPREL